MTDLSALANAVVENPKEDAPLHMLADEMLDKGDGRGEVLRRWLVAEGEDKDPVEDLSDMSMPPTHTQGFRPDEKGQIKIHTFPSVAYAGRAKGKEPVLNVRIERLAGGQNYFSRLHSVALPHSEAREVADSLPNAEEVHHFLDKHFGNDPRLVDGLNKALTPNDKDE